MSIFDFNINPWLIYFQGLIIVSRHGWETNWLCAPLSILRVLSSPLPSKKAVVREFILTGVMVGKL